MRVHYLQVNTGQQCIYLGKKMPTMDEKAARKNKIINISLILMLIAFIAFRVATACNMLE